MCCPGEDWKHYVRVLSIQCQALGKIQVKKNLLQNKIIYILTTPFFYGKTICNRACLTLTSAIPSALHKCREFLDNVRLTL